MAEPAADSAQRWREVRALLNARRHDLARAAAALYPGTRRVGRTVLLCRPEWIPAQPLGLDDIALSLTAESCAAEPAAAEPAAAEPAAAKPRGPAAGYPSYAEALAAIERPALLANRPSYRLLAADLAGDTPALSYTAGHYFDWVNEGEAVAHELASAWQQDPGLVAMEQLPLRAALGDPGDLPRRSALNAVTTLTLRVPAAAEPTFLLHWRDPAAVAHAGGLYQVMPVGVFQPADGTAAARSRDFDLWRCMIREFSEEFLGAPEDYGPGPLDYDRWPLAAALAAARASGKLRVRCLGLGADPLTLATDLLITAAFSADVFDAAFAGLVTANTEGRVVSWPGMTGIPFTAEVVARFAGGSEPVQPAGAAVLDLAWRHRGELLP